MSGLILIFLFWKHFLHPQWRKRVSGEYVHWKDLKRKLDEDYERLKQLERLLNNQIEKELEKDRLQGKIKDTLQDLTDKK
jgi:hypothetical protein